MGAREKILTLAGGSRGPVLVLGLLALALLFPEIVGWRGLFHDDLGFDSFPRYFFLADCFQRGILPLWDPTTWCGAIPFYARYFAETYYLPLWPFLVLAPLKNPSAAYLWLMPGVLAAHFFIAAAGMYALTRRLAGLGRAAALFSAAAYLFSPAFAYAYGWQQFVYQQAWLPWLLVFYCAAVRRRTRGAVVACALVLSFILASGSPEVWHYTLFVWGGCIAYETVLALRISEALGSRLRPFALACAAALLGAGLCAPYLFSFFDGMRFTSEHLELTACEALAEPGGSLPPAWLATLFVPGLFGNLTGKSLSLLSPESPTIYWEANLLGGFALTLLAFLGAWLTLSGSDAGVPAEQRRLTRLFVLMYFLSLLCLLGRHTPFYGWFVGWIPGVGQMPRPIRYRYFECFAAAFLSGLGVERLLSAGTFHDVRRRLFRRGARGYVLAALGAVLLCGLWPFGVRERQTQSWTLRPRQPMEGAFFPGEVHGKLFSCRVLSARIPGDEARAEGPFMNTGSGARAVKIALHLAGPASGQVFAGPSEQAAFPNHPSARFSFSSGGDVEIPLGTPVLAGQTIVLRFDSPADVGFYAAARPGGPQLFSSAAQGEFLRLLDPGFFAFDFLREETHRFVPPLFSIFRAPGSEPLLWLLYSLFAAAFVFWAAGRLVPARFGAALAALAAAELLAAGWTACYGGSFAFDSPAPNHRRAQGLSHPVAAAAAEYLAPFALSRPDLRVGSDAPFADNFMRLCRGAAFMGYDMHPLENRFKTAIETAFGRPANHFIYYTRLLPRPGFRPLLDHFSVGLWLGRGPLPGAQSRPVSGPDGTQWFLSLNPRALPRAYLMSRAERAADGRQLSALLSGDLSRAVFVSPDSLAVAADVPSAGPLAVERMDWSDPNRVSLRFASPGPAMLVLTEVWYPGWRAFVDGVERPVERVNYCQRGVWIAEAGEHSAELVFSPPAWRWGVLVWGACALLAGGALIFGRRKSAGGA